MKKRALFITVIFFALHALTWIVWGEKALIKKQLSDSLNDESCMRQEAMFAERVSSVTRITSNYYAAELRDIELGDSLITVYPEETDLLKELFDDTTTVVIEHQLLSNNTNPYLIWYSYSCQEWYWGCGTGKDYNVHLTVWAFFGWVKIIDEHSFLMLASSDYRKIYGE